jgi:hypothetical protein
VQSLNVYFEVLSSLLVACYCYISRISWGMVCFSADCSWYRKFTFYFYSTFFCDYGTGGYLQPFHHQQIRWPYILQGVFPVSPFSFLNSSRPRVVTWIICTSLQDYGSSGRMDTNDSLRLASLWHSMHAISQQLSPIPGCTGIDLLQAHNFDLHCFQSLTGM